MIYYITDENGSVVAQFDGRKVESKPKHQIHTLDSITDLPGVDEWDTDYEQ
jgi:hypothetical protein